MISTMRILHGVQDLLANLSEHRTGAQIGALISITGIAALVARNTRRISRSQREVNRCQAQLADFACTVHAVQDELDRQIVRDLFADDDIRLKLMFNPLRNN
jgi:hypothetical protein